MIDCTNNQNLDAPQRKRVAAMHHGSAAQRLVLCCASGRHGNGNRRPLFSVLRPLSPA